MIHVILGGTGTLGRELARLLLEKPGNKVRILARGEHRLNAMRREFSNDRLSFFVGDVRDRMRLRRALTGAQYVYHLAALKHVHTCEYDVLEAVRTNIEGTVNVVEACIDAGVEKAVFISTDKAVEPTTTYGATKMVGERLFVHGNHYAANKPPAFFAVRYGNVMASQGSVLKIWRDQAERGQPLTVVDPQMTRFWWTATEAAAFVHKCMKIGRPGDIYVPLLPSCNLESLAQMVAPYADMVSMAGHPMEKIHEDLIASHEIAMSTVMMDGTVRISMFKPPPPLEQPLGMRLNSSDFTDVEAVAQCLLDR